MHSKHQQSHLLTQIVFEKTQCKEYISDFKYSSSLINSLYIKYIAKFKILLSFCWFVQTLNPQLIKSNTLKHDWIPLSALHWKSHNKSVKFSFWVSVYIVYYNHIMINICTYTSTRISYKQVYCKTNMYCNNLKENYKIINTMSYWDQVSRATYRLGTEPLV